MNGYGGLPMTGATVGMGAVMFDQGILLGAAIAAVLLGVTMVRMTWRRRQPVGR